MLVIRADQTDCLMDEELEMKVDMYPQINSQNVLETRSLGSLKRQTYIE